MHHQKGFILIPIVLFLALFLTLGAVLTKIVYNANLGIHSALQQKQAFYLAEAGLEKGKVNLVHNPNWYTDLPNSAADNTSWLIYQAMGEKGNLAEGLFKVVRERGKSRLYSVGFKGKGIAVLKLEFSNPPFKSLEWEEL